MHTFGDAKHRAGFRVEVDDFGQFFNQRFDNRLLVEFTQAAGWTGLAELQAVEQFVNIAVRLDVKTDMVGSGIDKGIYSDENVRPNEIWMAVKVFPDYVRWALLNQEEEGAWKGIL